MNGGGDANPCTIGFWKNRSLNKKGVLKFFPAGEFDSVVGGAVLISGGVFTSASGTADFDALLFALQSKGNRTPEERARQQLAAYFLNLAAGDLFPDQDKCKLFETNDISSNACGSNITVQEADTFISDNFNMGNFEAAKDCADDLNNGIGLDVTGAE